MSNESLHEIERDVERHRSELTGAINELQSRFSPESLVRAVADGLRDHGGDVGTAIGKSVRQNPVALALTGVGLAWMMFGRSYDDRPAVQYRDSRRSDEQPRGESYRAAGYPDPDRVPHANTGSYETGGFEGGTYRSEGYRSGYRSGSRAPSWLETDDRAYRASGSREEDNGPSLGERASDAAHRASGAASDAAHRVGDAASDMAHGIEDRIANARAAAADTASDLRDRLYHGTEDLTEAARERIAAARHRAIEARRSAGPAMRRQWESGRDRAVDFFEEQPLIAGALALAVGAAIASALPRTRTEDAWMGEQSDHLIDEAERIFQEESAKALKVGKAALREAGNIVEEKREELGQSSASVAEAVKAEAHEAAHRVKDAATTEAERQGLTKS